MPDQPPESDWKTFRKLREQALEEFCAKTVSEIANLAERPARGAHQNYLDIYNLIQERDETIARVFNEPRRSAMLIQFCSIYRLGLIDEGDLGRFTQETRSKIEIYLNA